MSSNHSASAKSPWPLIILGTPMFIVGIVLIMLEVTATEGNVQGANYILFRPSFAIFAQIPGLLTGDLNPNLIPAVEIAWGIELLFLACVIAWDVLQEISPHPVWKAALEIAMGAAILIDWYTNYQYSVGFANNNVIWRGLLSVLMCIFVALFPIGGFRLVERGVHMAWKQGHGTMPALVPVRHQGN